MQSSFQYLTHADEIGYYRPGRFYLVYSPGLPWDIDVGTPIGIGRIWPFGDKGVPKIREGLLGTGLDSHTLAMPNPNSNKYS
jgi:hypothetical protein